MSMREQYEFKKLGTAPISAEDKVSPIESTQCPHCNCKMSRVTETRNLTLSGQLVKVRVRLCRNCKSQFRTKEIVDTDIKLSETRGIKANHLDVGGNNFPRIPFS